MEAFTRQAFSMPETDAESEGAEVAVDPLADLPPINTTRWVASRKAAVLVAIADGRLSRISACARYRISEAELRLWERAVKCAGIPGLRVTRVQIYREVFESRGTS